MRTLPEYCTIRQATQLVQVSRRTIYKWLEAGKVEARRTAGGQQRIRTATLWQKNQHSRWTH